MCTSIKIESLENNVYIGRTLEDVFNLEYAFVTFPKGYESLQGLEPWTLKYSIIGMGITGGDAVIDGINEHGLMVAALNFRGCNEYATVEEIHDSGKFPLYPEQVATWILGNCKNLSDVKEEVSKIAIANLSVGDTYKSQPNPLHFIIQDKLGETLVVEPNKKLELEIYNNPIGILTNSPNFPWHIENLRNYTMISDTNAPDAQIEDYLIKSNGKGTGLRLMPGDSSSVSRFVRASYFKMFTKKTNDDNAINTLFHMFSSFDIPKGLIKLTDNELQHTQYTIVYDLDKLCCYAKLYNDLHVRYFKFHENDLQKNRATFYPLKPKDFYKCIEKY